MWDIVVKKNRGGYKLDTMVSVFYVYKWSYHKLDSLPVGFKISAVLRFLFTNQQRYPIIVHFKLFGSDKSARIVVSAVQ